MAEKYGGHDYEFVGAVSDRFNCSICTKVLRDPHLAVCCGQHFCESCLNKWFTRQGKESCPYCRAEGEGFHHVINKGLRSEVIQLKTKCSNRGCQWTGEMGTLKRHLNRCDFVMVECPNKCIRCTIQDFKNEP
jgi:TNF receptor-associated factor 4